MLITLPSLFSYTYISSVGVPCTPWILMADYQMFSFSTLIMKPTLMMKPPRRSNLRRKFLHTNLGKTYIYEIRMKITKLISVMSAQSDE